MGYATEEITLIPERNQENVPAVPEPRPCMDENEKGPRFIVNGG